jgi:hypothetical protein
MVDDVFQYAMISPTQQEETTKGASPETMKKFENIVPEYDKEANYTLDFCLL